MAKSDPQEEPEPEPTLLVPETSFPTHPSKSIFLPKLLFLLFLLFLPFSPSRVPEFINETVFAQFWEFLHIIFFGIAVSYGLLSRKNQNAGTHHPPQSQNYFSGILRFPSVSEENNNTMKTRIETWNSRYLPTRSMEMSSIRTKPRSVMEYKPLGLPIRSLRSTKVDHTDIQQESSDQRSCWSSSEDSVSSVEIEMEEEKEKGKVRGLVPINLEKKFKETSAIPWKRSSGSGRRKKKIDDESESFWASVLSENSPSLPYSPKNMKVDGGNFEGRALLRGKSVRTIRTENMYKKRNNVCQEVKNYDEEKEEETERSSTSIDSSSTIDEMEEEEEEEESVERDGDVAEKEVDHDDDDDDDDDHGHDDEEDGKEVDRKADEFIAKFREQIRLQKVNSARGFKNW